MPLSRRRFCSLATVSLGSHLAPAHLTAAQMDTATSRPDVAAIDHDRILKSADTALHSPVETLTSQPLPATAPTGTAPGDFVADDDDHPSATSRSMALLHFTLAVPALTAAAHLLNPAEPPRAEPYARRACEWLDAWFTTPATRMTPTFATARLAPDTRAPLPSGVVEGAALAEVAKAIPFLLSTGVVQPEQLAAWRRWFTDLAEWLDTTRLAGLARDSKDCTGSAWLLLRGSCAAVLADDTALTRLRHSFRSVTIRAQIRADGTFPHELTTPYPYRNSLFNLDMLAACADLLSTRFETVWDYELQDGPGMRAAIARHAPWIANRATWPYPADIQHFNELPCRRPSLLLAARALQQGNYATIWRTLNPDPTDPVILRSFPLRQPLLWTVRPRPARV